MKNLNTSLAILVITIIASAFSFKILSTISTIDFEHVDKADQLSLLL